MAYRMAQMPMTLSEVTFLVMTDKKPRVVPLRL